MKTSPLLLLAAAILPASAIQVTGAWYDGLPFGHIGPGFDNTIKTDALGSEDGTTVEATATPTFVGSDTRYDIDFRASVGFSYNLTLDKDVNETTEVELLIRLFDPFSNKLGRVEITGMDLTKFEMDETGATEGYPSLRLAVKPTEPALSASYQTPFTARLGISLRFDAAFDNDFQTVIVTNAAKDEFGAATHPSSSLGVGVSTNYAGLDGEPTKFRFFIRSGLVDSYGSGYDFGDVQGSVNGYTFPSGFSFEDKGSPASLGITYDLGYAGQLYRAYDLEYDGFDGDDDFQIGVNFAPRDTDSDGLPDDWEDMYGFNKNVRDPASSDSDGDRQREWDEYLQGTDPRDWQSQLRVRFADYDYSTGNLVITWDSESGRDYLLEHLNQTTWGWEGVPDSGIIPSDGATTSYTIEDPIGKLGDTAQLRVKLQLDF